MQQPEVAAAQFGVAAADYLTSPIHANGPDLEQLKHAVGMSPDAVVLDIGCGAGHASFALAPLVREVHAYDVAESMVATVARVARERNLINIATRQGPAEALPYSNASFDIVVSRLSAHHWRDVPKALCEVRRVLRPAGRIVWIDVAGHPDPLLDIHLQSVELLRDRSHVRDYTVSEWQALFATAGFRHEHLSTWRIPVEFRSWIARMRTPPDCEQAIRHLWTHAPQEARDYYSVRGDFSFELDAFLITARVR
jgi:SAM-dependent methyltransferase